MYYECYISKKIDVSEGIDVKKTSASKERNICHYWYFLNYNFKFQLNAYKQMSWFMNECLWTLAILPLQTLKVPIIAVLLA